MPILLYYSTYGIAQKKLFLGTQKSTKKDSSLFSKVYF